MKLHVSCNRSNGGIGYAEKVGTDYATMPAPESAPGLTQYTQFWKVPQAELSALISNSRQAPQLLVQQSLSTASKAIKDTPSGVF